MGHSCPCLWSLWTVEESSLEVSTGQPFLLGILQGFQELTGDVDTELPQLLHQGVRTGTHSSIKASGAFAPEARERRLELVSEEVLLCDENWQSAEEHAELVIKLLEADRAEGFCVLWEEDMQTAIDRWGHDRVAQGKLAVVLEEGRDPRLIGDQTACRANPRAR